jgi:hypothetical protein
MQFAAAGIISRVERYAKLLEEKGVLQRAPGAVAGGARGYRNREEVGQLQMKREVAH